MRLRNFSILLTDEIPHPKIKRRNMRGIFSFIKNEIMEFHRYITNIQSRNNVERNFYLFALKLHHPQFRFKLKKKRRKYVSTQKVEMKEIEREMEKGFMQACRKRRKILNSYALLPSNKF